MFFINVKAQEDIDVSAKSAILICADSENVIWAKNENEPLPMASTTKIMTALLALEYMQANGNKEIEITNDMVMVEGTSMGLAAGDIISLESLAQGMLLCSGNDAANSAAIAVGGSIENFVKMMNEKATILGLKDTKFCTPSGLDQGNHHSTAKDMAVLGAYAMENDDFANIVSKKSMSVKFINPSKVVNYKNHNKLLRLYDACIGVKTGFTKSAGRCLVSCAQKGEAKLICVTLNAPNDWDDHIKLYNYGFENVVVKTFDDQNFRIQVPVKNCNTSVVNAECLSQFSACLKKDQEDKIERKIELPSVCSAPIEKGQILGNVVYYYQGNVIGKNNIIATESISNESANFKKGHFNSFKQFFKKIFKK